MFTEVRFYHSLAILHGNIRLSQLVCTHRWKGRLVVNMVNINKNAHNILLVSCNFIFWAIEILFTHLHVWVFYLSDILCTWRSIAVHTDLRPNTSHWPQTRGTSRRSDVWLVVVRSRRLVTVLLDCWGYMYVLLGPMRPTLVVGLDNQLCGFVFRYTRLGGQSTRGRLPVWKRRCSAVQLGQWHRPHLPRTSTCHGRLQTPF